MALERAGVQLVAEGTSAFVGDLGRAEKAVAGFAQTATGGQKSVGGFGQVAIGMARRAGGAIVEFGMKAVGAVADFAAASLDTAQDYEQSMNVLQEQSGATGAEMDRVREKAKALGADLSLPAVSAATAGEAMLELSKGGLTLQESMDAAKGTLMLAAAAETDVATAANITTGALKAFGLEGNKAGYIADLLANSANQSRASITDLGAGFQQAAFRFRAAGMGADDLAASLAILTNNGLTGSDAGTALQNAIARLQAPTKQATAAMRQYGISVYDANGNMRPMREIIGTLNNRLGGLTQQERNAALSTIFLSDGMKAIIPLMASQVEGYDKMKAAVNKAGSAQALAAAQMKGLKGDSEGLQSQLETLALEALEPLLPLMAANIRKAAEFAGTFVGKVGPAVKAVIKFVGQAGDLFQELFIPAVSAAGAALLLYAIKSIPAAVAALPGLISTITAATSAFAAQALAVAAAAAPYLLVAAAIGGVVLAYQNLKNKIADATTQLLNSRQWWTDSAAALDVYANASDEVKTKVSAHAATIKELRSEIEAEVRDLGMRKTAGELTEEQYQAELGEINGKIAGLKRVTEAMDQEVNGLVKAQAAQTTATQATADFTAAQDPAQAEIQLTAEELDKLAKAFTKIMEEGARAGSMLVTTEATFHRQMVDGQATHNATIAALYKELEGAKTKEQADGIKERIKKEEEGFKESTANALKAYAEQAHAQKQALGEQLLAYIENQREMGNISDEKAAEMSETTIKHFGITRDSTAALFGEMAQSVDKFASGAIGDADDVGKAWNDAEQDAVSLKEKADRLKDKYIMEIIADFEAGRITIEEAQRMLAEIPPRVESEIVITTRHEDIYGTRDEGALGTRAGGGPVRAASMYLVGEEGQELFVPDQNGTIVDASTTRTIMQSLAMPETRAAPASPNTWVAPHSTIYNQQRTINMPVYTNQTPAVLQQSMAITQAMTA